MAAAFESLVVTDSPLRRLDARWKLAAFVPAILAAALLQTLPAAGASLLGAGFLAVLGRLPRRWCLRRLGIAAVMLTPFLGLLPLVEGLEGLRVALVLGLKTLALVLLALVLLAATPLPELFKAAQALYVPATLVQVAALTYRYLFVLLGELDRIRVALRVRGYRNRVSLHSYRTAGHVAGALLVRGHDRAERVGQALRCRGFDGRFRSLGEFRTRAADVALLVAVCGGAVALLVWDLLCR